MVSAVLIANGDPNIGGGHIARSLTLGRALMGKGVDVRMLIKPEAVDMLDGFWVGEFDVSASAFTETDLNKAAVGADIVCLDNYEWSAAFERRIGQPGRKLVVIDDLANRQHDCDLLIDQNFGRSPYDYDNLTPQGATLLIGSDYALLRPQFQLYRDAAIARRSTNEPAQRLLISIGVHDIGGVALHVVSAVRDAGIECVLDVVLSKDAQSIELLSAMAAADDALNLHVDPKDPAKLMLNADLAIGDMGSSTWERFCMGLPCVGLILADSQKNTAKRLEAAGLMKSFMNNEAGRIAAAAHLKELIESPADRRSQSHLIAGRVDGKGADRAADAILKLCARP